MYQTYQSEPVKKNEEKLIPKEITNDNCNVKPCKKQNTSRNLFSGINNEDLLILGLLFLLYNEDCQDNMLLMVLVALLFIKW